MHCLNRSPIVFFAALLAVILTGCGVTKDPPADTAPIVEIDDAAPGSPVSTIEEPSRTQPAVAACASNAEVQEANNGEVLVYFACGAGNQAGDFHSFARPVEEDDSLAQKLDAAVFAYLAGPLPGEGQNYFTFAGTDALNSTQVVGSRAVIDIDFDGVGMSTSSQSTNIWTALRLVAFQFPAITEMEPRWNGSCEAFGAAVQAGGCLIALRSGDSVPGP